MPDANKQPGPNPKSTSNWLVPLIVAVVVAGVFLWVRQQNQPAPQSSDSTAPAATSEPIASMAPEVTGDTVPSYFASAEAAKPYPATLPPEQFPNPIVAHAYQVAKEIPGTLAQQPCYCYCSITAGHRGLLDCYADLHASSCSVCIQEALLAEKLTKEGRSASEIREAIIRGDWRTVELN
jgi:Protein of unknown function with PCYCGC motif